MGRKAKVQWQRRNNTGSITDLSKSRPDIRNKFMARAIVDHRKDKNGKNVPVRKCIGYFETYEAAEEALKKFYELIETNDGMYSDEMLSDETFEQVWNMAVEQYELDNPTMSKSRRNGFKSTYNYFPEELRKARFLSVPSSTLVRWFNELKKKKDEKGKPIGYATLKRIKTDVKMMYSYAKSMRDVKLDNYGDNLSLPRHDTKKKEVMSLDEIKKIWTMRLNQQGNAQAKFVVDTILMLMYTGVRIDELLSVKTENVNMSDMWFDVVKAKTVNGVRRIPIHPAVYNIFQQYFDESNPYLLTNPNTKRKYSYANYRDSYWDQLREQLGWAKERFTPHITRRTFISYAYHYKVSAEVRHAMVGHSGNLSTEEEYYLTIPVSELMAEVKKIPRDYNDLIDLKSEYIIFE